MQGDLSLAPQNYFNDAVTTVQQVKAAAGSVMSIVVANTTAAVAYLQVFFLPSANVTLGTTAPEASFRLEANANRVIVFEYPFGDPGATGISIAGTTTATGSSGAALSVVMQYL